MVYQCLLSSIIFTIVSTRNWLERRMEYFVVHRPIVDEFSCIYWRISSTHLYEQP